MVKLHDFFFMNFGLGFLKIFGENVELCVIDECDMKRMREVLFFQGQLSAKCICCKINNLPDSSLNFQREFEWENKGIRIGFLRRSCSSGCLLSKETCLI